MEKVNDNRHYQKTLELVKSDTLKLEIAKVLDSTEQPPLKKCPLGISLVMLVKNQENNVEEVLLRAKNLNLDEYVVVDTGSSDSTVSILRELDFVQVHEVEWVEDYAYMRNMAASFAKYDWVLTLDSDELILSENVDIKSLIKLVSQVISEPFSINFEQHSSGTSAFDIPAKVYNSKKASYYGLVHEELRSTKTGELVIGVVTGIAVQNIGSSEEEVIKFNKNQRYARLLERMMQIEPENPRWFSLLPHSYVKALSRDKGYLQLSNKYLFKEGKFAPSEREILVTEYTSSILGKHVLALIDLGDIHKAITLVETGIKMYPSDIYLRFYRGYIRVQSLKNEINAELKNSLGEYLSFDKQKISEDSHRDTQLMLVLLAELNKMAGNYEMAQSITDEITDCEVIKVLKSWRLI